MGVWTDAMLRSAELRKNTPTMEETMFGGMANLGNAWIKSRKERDYQDSMKKLARTAVDVMEGPTPTDTLEPTPGAWTGEKRTKMKEASSRGGLDLGLLNRGAVEPLLSQEAVPDQPIQEIEDARNEKANALASAIGHDPSKSTGFISDMIGNWFANERAGKQADAKEKSYDELLADYARDTANAAAGAAAMSNESEGAPLSYAASLARGEALAESMVRRRMAPDLASAKAKLLNSGFLDRNVKAAWGAKK